MDPNTPQVTPQNTAPQASPTTEQTPLPQAAPQASTQALYEGKFWYFPEGVHTVFSAKSGKVQVVTGEMIVFDELTGQEVRRTPLNSQTVYKASLGMFRFKQINGQKVGAMDSSSMLYGYNPKLNLLSYWFMIFNRKGVKELAAAADRAKI